MKKYTIKDKSGTKKTIYAKDLAHALTFVDSKVKDDIRPEFVPEKIRKIAETAAKKVNATVKYDGFDKHITVYFEPKSSIISNNFEETLNKELSRYGWKIGSFGRNGLAFYTKDSIKDEANLPTTLQALVNDEEAAIKAYEVAIKNLEGKIDETQMQVLINIMKDERRHVENLYAILNGQVTEKNLKDASGIGSDVEVRLKPDEIRNVRSYNLTYKNGVLYGDEDDIADFMVDYGYWKYRD